MIKELLNRLPQNVLVNIEKFKRDYKGLPNMREETRARMAGYAQGLADASLITERERQMIFVYMTV